MKLFTTLLMGLSLLGLVGCGTAEPTASPLPIPNASALPTAENAAVPTPLPAEPATLSAEFYYLLNEGPASIVEVSTRTLQETRTFPLAAVVGLNPEGIAFVPNADIEQYGFYGLPTSPNGGYFVIATQKDGTLHIVDVPLLNVGSTTEKLVLEVPSLKEDASDVFYRPGELWVVSSSEKRLYHLALTATEGEADVVEEYKLKDLFKDFEDVEGLAFGSDGALYVGDDLNQSAYRFDNFPACMANEACQLTWSKYMSTVEVSGLYWDVANGYLLVVDDSGRLFSLDNDTLNPNILLTTEYDLEGITMVR